MLNGSSGFNGRPARCHAEQRVPILTNRDPSRALRSISSTGHSECALRVTIIPSDPVEPAYMFIPSILALSLVVALLRGGRLSRLFDLPIRYAWLFFIPLALQLLLFTSLRSTFKLSGNADRILYLVSMAIVAVVLWLNRRLPGIWWIIAGFTLNFLVITLNGGFMPVSNAARAFAGLPSVIGRSHNVIPMTDTTILPWLGDILPLPAWMPAANVFSVGDVLVVIGEWILIQRALVKPSPRTQGSTN